MTMLLRHLVSSLRFGQFVDRFVRRFYVVELFILRLDILFRSSSFLLLLFDRLVASSDRLTNLIDRRQLCLPRGDVARQKRIPDVTLKSGGEYHCIEQVVNLNHGLPLCFASG